MVDSIAGGGGLITIPALLWAGITPALSQEAADVCLQGIQAARRKGITVSGDIFYRSNLWKYGKGPADILPALTAGTDIVIANQENIRDIYGIESTGFQDACQKLQAAFPQVSRVVDTKRTSPSASHNLLRAYLWNGSAMLETEDIEINPIVDRVGGVVRGRRWGHAIHRRGGRGVLRRHGMRSMVHHLRLRRQRQRRADQRPYRHPDHAAPPS